jgi:hypothetical protein
MKKRHSKKTTQRRSDLLKCPQATTSQTSNSTTRTKKAVAPGAVEAIPPSPNVSRTRSGVTAKIRSEISPVRLGLDDPRLQYA